MANDHVRPMVSEWANVPEDELELDGEAAAQLGDGDLAKKLAAMDALVEEAKDISATEAHVEEPTSHASAATGADILSRWSKTHSTGTQ